MNQLDLLGDTPTDYSSPRFPPPRPFQADAHVKLQDGARAGHRGQMIMAPTGAGKTYLGLNIIQRALAKGRRAVFVCDRTALINQTSAAADKYGLSAHGVVQADHWRTNGALPFQIASAQSLTSRGWPKADVIVIDEAHTQYESWVSHIMKTDAAVIGLSATPFSKGLGKMFTNLVNAATMDQLTRDGVLVPMRVLRCTPVDMAGAATAGGEWTDKAAEERGMQIVGDVVVEWSRWGENRKTICFGATIAHVEEICSQFIKAGVMAAMYTSHTKDEERAKLLEEFAKPDSSIRVLISVEALAKGFDVQDVGCVIDVRPMRKSLSTVIQMWGRGLRSFPGKEDCILLDHSGNSLRFAESFEQIYFEGLERLDDGEKMDSEIRQDPPSDKPIAKCPSCGFKPFAKHCMRCGYERAPTSTLEHQPGKMEEVQLGRGKTAVTINREALYQECVAYARNYSKPDKQKGRAAHLFKDFTGEWPPHHWTPDKVPRDAKVSSAIENKIIYRNIKNAKTRALA